MDDIYYYILVIDFKICVICVHLHLYLLWEGGRAGWFVHGFFNTPDSMTTAC